jgi:hypothetical protein
VEWYRWSGGGEVVWSRVAVMYWWRGVTPGIFHGISLEGGRTAIRLEEVVWRAAVVHVNHNPSGVLEIPLMSTLK